MREQMKAEYKDYYMFLESLRQSGATNMWGAAPYLVQAFNISTKEARDILSNWMYNYSEISAKYYK